MFFPGTDFSSLIVGWKSVDTMVAKPRLPHGALVNDFENIIFSLVFIFYEIKSPLLSGQTLENSLYVFDPKSIQSILFKHFA